MIRVIDKTIGHTFECESMEAAHHFVAAIELLGHEAVLLRPKETK